ncbi:unnamed protein product [Boreogadus saida]
MALPMGTEGVNKYTAPSTLPQGHPSIHLAPGSPLHPPCPRVTPPSTLPQGHPSIHLAPGLPLHPPILWFTFQTSLANPILANARPPPTPARPANCRSCSLTSTSQNTVGPPARAAC